ncbi:phosphoserine phosphatase SerB [Sphingosinicella sp. BN140058]|uniref:phosphoserine phosphatase SerB n=1 Tax=Sphingosinicella sp. BN140058 TaxID=1892855 RepID=UPI001012C524|nr:phosphoserine phosphatase SerB [Sphingosinicella sp. BN140058]QAY79091.1 phosphoserine phosphatase SerB [Sphingosinicella sp. BN140058]
MFIATLIAADQLSGGDISTAEDLLRDRGVEPMGRSWIERDKACDLLFSADPAPIRSALEGRFAGVDVIVQGEASRRKTLLVADMDSTMITVECIDELADYAGLKAEVAEITERAMRGELQFEQALRARVALLKDLDEAMIDRCRNERVRLTPGARALVRTMRRDGALTILVSGGFTAFAEPVGAEIGFERVLANRLLGADGRLDGTVGEPIVGADTKRATLLHALAERSLDAAEALAVGDGANDIPMIEAAGLGVAFHAKPAAAAAADARIAHGDLTVLLYAQGYARSEWAD